MTPTPASDETAPFRMWVQASKDSQTATGIIASGRIKTGDRVKALPSAKHSRVVRIATPSGDTATAAVGQSVTLTLESAVDIAPGDLLAAADAAPSVADQFN